MKIVRRLHTGNRANPFLNDLNQFVQFNQFVVSFLNNLSRTSRTGDTDSWHNETQR